METEPAGAPGEGVEEPWKPSPHPDREVSPKQVSEGQRVPTGQEEDGTGQTSQQRRVLRVPESSLAGQGPTTEPHSLSPQRDRPAGQRPRGEEAQGSRTAEGGIVPNARPRRPFCCDSSIEAALRVGGCGVRPLGVAGAYQAPVGAAAVTAWSPDQWPRCHLGTQKRTFSPSAHSEALGKGPPSPGICVFPGPPGGRASEGVRGHGARDGGAVPGEGDTDGAVVRRKWARGTGRALHCPVFGVRLTSFATILLHHLRFLKHPPQTKQNKTKTTPRRAGAASSGSPLRPPRQPAGHTRPAGAGRHFQTFESVHNGLKEQMNSDRGFLWNTGPAPPRRLSPRGRAAPATPCRRARRPRPLVPLAWPWRA